MKMYQICKLPYFINIGKAGNNLYKDIIINCKDWLDKYPDAEISATFIRPGGTTMSPELEIDGTKRIWKPTAEETMYAGTGYLEIKMTAEEVVGKSVTVEIIIEEDVTGSPVTPTPTPPSGGGGGADGFSPTITVTAITGGHRVTITDVNGTRSFNVLDGTPGIPGASGAPGADGISPTVTVTDLENGHRVTITDAAGTRYFDVLNGMNGADGAQGPAGPQGTAGADGEDGVSPTVAVVEIEGGHRVTITDADGPHVFDVLDGAGANYPPEGGIPESDLSNEIKDKLNDSQYVLFTLTGKKVTYHPVAEPEIETEFKAIQAGVGLASPTNIRPITPVAGLTLGVNGTELTVDFGANIGEGIYNWNTGKLLKTYHATVLTGNENAGLFHESTSNGFRTIEYEIDAYSSPYGKGSGVSYCSHFGAAIGGYSHGYNFSGLGAGSDGTPPKARRYIFSYDGSRADFIAYLKAQNAAGTPVTFAYEMQVPVEMTFTPQTIPHRAGANTATGDGILTIHGRMDSESVFGSADLLGSYGMLKDKTVVFGGDSLTGNPPAGLDYPSYVAKYIGVNAINAGFGGTRMAIVNDSTDSTRPALSMASLSEAISDGDWDDVDNAIAQHPSSYVIKTWNTETDYVPTHLAALKAVDWDNVDYYVMLYGTNDFTSSVALEGENAKDPHTFKGAIRTTIENILGRYPNVKIMLVSPPWRWWDENTDDAGINSYIDSDTRVNSIGLKLKDYVTAIMEVAAEYHIPAYDLYDACFLNKETRYATNALYDGTHPFPFSDGYDTMARLISGFLLSPYAMPPVSGNDGGGDYPPTGGVKYADLSTSLQNAINNANSAVQPSALAAYQPTAITDAGGYFTDKSVEGALAELAEQIDGVDDLIGSGVIS